MSLLPTKRVSRSAKLSVYGFIRRDKLVKLSIPDVIFRIIMLYFYTVDTDYWEDHDVHGEVVISNEKKELYLQEMNPKHTINIKGENIIKSNDYDGTNRRIYIWTLSPFQIGFYNMWEIGLQGKRGGFFGINRNGYTSCSVPPDTPIRTLNYFNLDDARRSFNLDNKAFNYDDKLKIKMYFEPSKNNDKFDIEFHKNNRLILEYRSIPIGDDYKLSVNFIKFSEYLNAHSTIFNNDMTWLQEIKDLKKKYVGFEINNFEQKNENIHMRELWIQKR